MSLNTSKTDNEAVPVPVKLSDLETHLSLPSGLSLNQAKRRAKEIRSSQEGISLTDAKMFVAWGNGLPKARGWEQVIEDCCQHTLGLPHTEMVLLKEATSEKWRGFAYKSRSRGWLEVTNRARESKADVVSKLAAWLSEELSSSKKRGRFLKALNEALTDFPSSTYRLNGESKLRGAVVSLHDVSFDIDKAMREPLSGGQFAFLMAVIGFYNGSALRTSLIRNIFDNSSFQEESRLSEDQLLDVEEALINRFPNKFGVGAGCIAMDSHNRKLICELMENYQGW